MTMSRRALSISTMARGAFSHFITLCTSLTTCLCKIIWCIYTDQWRNQRYSFYRGSKFHRCMGNCSNVWPKLSIPATYISVMLSMRYQWDNNVNEIHYLFNGVWAVIHCRWHFFVCFGGVKRFSENAELHEYICEIYPQEGRAGN